MSDLHVLVFNMPEITGPLSESLPTFGGFCANVRPLASVLVLVLNLIDFERKLLVTIDARKPFFFEMKSIIMSDSSVRVFILLTAAFVLTVVHIIVLLVSQSLLKRPKRCLRSTYRGDFICYLIVYKRLVRLLVKWLLS